MSFWGRAVEAVEDGWDDADDIDLSDNDNDNDDEGIDEEDSQQQQQQQHDEEEEEEEPTTTGIPLGGGILMGRLTRLFETAAPPPAAEEDDDEDAQLTPTIKTPSRASRWTSGLTSYLTDATTPHWQQDLPEESLGLDNNDDDDDDSDYEEEDGWQDDDEELEFDDDDDDDDKNDNDDNNMETTLETTTTITTTTPLKLMSFQPTTPATAQVSLGVGMEARRSNHHDLDQMEDDSLGLDVSSAAGEGGGWDEPELEMNDNVEHYYHNHGDNDQVGEEEEDLLQDEGGWDDPDLDDALDDVEEPIVDEPHRLDDKEQDLQPENKTNEGNHRPDDEEEGGWDELDIVDDDDVDGKEEVIIAYQTPEQEPEQISEQGWNDSEINIDDIEEGTELPVDREEPGQDETATEEAEDSHAAPEGWDGSELDVVEISHFDAPIIEQRPEAGRVQQEPLVEEQLYIEDNIKVSEEYLDENATDDYPTTTEIAKSEISAWNDSALEDLDDNDEEQDPNQGAGSDEEEIDTCLHAEGTGTEITSEVGVVGSIEAPMERVQRSVAFANGNSSYLVDHVPADTPLVRHRDSTVAFGSTDSGTIANDSIGDELEVMDPDNQDFGPVVDHLPSPHQPRVLNAPTASVVTQAASTIELDEQSATSSYHPRSINGIRHPPLPPPPLVDHVPTDTPGTGHKDSTIAVAGEQSSTVMEDVWREDFDPEDQDYGPIVDNVPPQRPPTWGRGAYYRNLEASIEELDDESAEEEKKDSLLRPHQPSVASVAGSMDVFAPIAENDDDEDNTVDRTAVEDEEAEAMSQEPPIEGLINEEDKEPQLVDHIPFRPESRANDASTLAFVDASEGSTVGDLTHEENVYLPVVDHTPPPRSLMNPSATESVIVAAPKSECPEELEFQDEVAADGAVDDDDDGATLDTRSIGLQDDGTKVVDHVPDAPGLRRVNSEMATTDMQSIMSTTSFGLVVDVTPLPVHLPSIPDSVAPLATLSEGETLRSESIATEANESRSDRMVDRLPPNSDAGSRLGSFMAMKSVISEDETLDDEQQDGYGPVVSAVPQSRGGSTHGLLATLSEVDYGTEAATVDGWESVDNDMAASVGDEELTIEEDFDRTPETKNKSVSFRNQDQSPFFLKPPLFSGDDDDTINTHSLDGTRMNATLDETKYYDANSKLECSVCAQSTSLDCPCVQRILGAPGNPKAAIVSVMSPEGVPVDVDYNKLLHTEVTKRLLMEKEVERYQAMFKALTNDVDAKSKQHASDRENLLKLEKSQLVIVSEVEVQRDMNISLREESEKKAKEMTRLEGIIASLNLRNDEANNRVDSLERQIDELRESSKDETEKAAASFRELKDQMSSEVSGMESEKKELLERVEKLQSNILILEQQSDELREQSRAAQVSLAEFIDKEHEWSLHKSELQAQLSLAQGSLSELRSIEFERSEQDPVLREQLAAALNDLTLFGKKECDWVAQESEIRAQLSEAQSSLSVLENKELEWSANETTLRAKLNTALSSLSDFTNKEQEWSSMESKLKDQLCDAQNKLSDFARIEIEWTEQQSAMKSEMDKLQQILQETTASTSTATGLEQLVASLKVELAGRDSECERLNAQVGEAEIRLREAEARNFAQMKENMRVSKQHETAVAKLSEELQLLSKLHEVELESRDAKALQVESQLDAVAKETTQLKTLNDELSQTVKYKQSLLDTREKNEEKLRRDTIAEKARIDAKVKLLENEKIDLLRELEHIGRRLVEASDNSALDVLMDENRVLQETLVANHDKVEQMQAQLEKFASERDGLFQVELQLSLVTKEKDRLISAVQNGEDKIRELRAQLDEIQHQTIDGAQNASALNESTASLHAAIQNAEEALSQKIVQFSQKETEMETLRSELTTLSLEHGELCEERDSLLVLCQDLENTTEVFQSSSHETESRLQSTENEVLALKNQLEISTAERSHLMSRGKEFEECALAADRLHREQVEHLQSEMESRLLEASEFQSALNQKMASSQIEAEMNRRNIQDLENKIKMLLQQAADSESMISQLQSDFNEQLTATKSERDNERSKLIDVESRVSTLQEEISMKDTVIARLQQDLLSINSQGTDASAETNRLLAHCTELEAKLYSLGAEKVIIIEKMEQSEQHLSQLSNDHASVVYERDQVLQERNLLEEDNEELLVQLGLTKEQLENAEREIENLHSELETKEHNAILVGERMHHAEETSQFFEAELEKFRTSQYQSDASLSVKVEELTRAKDNLTMSNAELVIQVEKALSENKVRSDELRATSIENKSMSHQLQKLQMEQQRLLSDSTARSQDQESHAFELEARVCGLDAVCQQQIEQIDRLTAQLRDTEASMANQAAEEAASLKRQICNLERFCADRDSILQQKELALEEMRQQLESLRDDAIRTDRQALAEMSRQVDSLSGRLQDSEHKSNQLIHRVKELEALYESAQFDLQSTLEKLSVSEATISNLVLEMKPLQEDVSLKEQYMARVKELELAYGAAHAELQATLEKLSSTEVALLNLELEMDQNKEDATEKDTYERNLASLKHIYEQRVNELQQELLHRDLQIKQMEADKQGVQSHLLSLESDLSMERKQCSILSASLQEANKDCSSKETEMESLKAKLTIVEQQLASSVDQGAREEQARKEISKMRASISRKKDRIVSLEEQLKTLTVELSSNQNQLVTKESELQKISVALEQLRVEQLATTQRVTAEVLGVTTNRDEAESSENMRSLIISLSKALENSESERAEAIDCLLKERKANTDSLKRLGESVKRFYSTLNSTSTP